MNFGYLIVALIIIAFLFAAIKIVREYERLVVFRLGHYIASKGPGIVIIIPIIDSFVRVSLRTVTLDVPTQDVITRDNVTASVNAVVYYKVVEPANSVINVEDYAFATGQMAQTTLRSVAGQADLDQLLGERDRLNLDIQKILDEATDNWGIKVTAVEIKDVVLPDELRSAIARQAEAERERRAIVIRANGEREAADQLAQAAAILNRQAGGLTIRMFRTLTEIAGEKGTLITLPLPVELGSLLRGYTYEPEKQ